MHSRCAEQGNLPDSFVDLWIRRRGFLSLHVCAIAGCSGMKIFGKCARVLMLSAVAWALVFATSAKSEIRLAQACGMMGGPPCTSSSGPVPGSITSPKFLAPGARKPAAKAAPKAVVKPAAAEKKTTKKTKKKKTKKKSSSKKKSTKKSSAKAPQQKSSGGGGNSSSGSSSSGSSSSGSSSSGSSGSGSSSD
jgi:uncharacterized membrane protein YgcG